MKKISVISMVCLLSLLSLALCALAQSTAPQLQTITDKTVSEGSLLSFTVTASAADSPAGSDVIFGICRAADASATCTPAVPSADGLSTLTIGSTTARMGRLSATEGQFNWTPDASQSGTYYIRISAADTDSSDAHNVRITVDDVAPVLSVTSLQLGGSSQERSNPRHDEERSRNVNVTQTIRITNIGSEQLTGLTFEVLPAVPFSSADLNTKLSLDKTTLASGESATATVEMRVPQSLNAVTNLGAESAFAGANIRFEASRTQTAGKVSATSAVTMQAENNLVIRKGKISFGDESETFKDGDDIKDLRPGDVVRIELELENKFKDREDVAIEDVEVSIVSDDELDIDEEEDINDLSPEDKETVTIEFDIDEDASRGTETLVITVIGTDENGARHGERWEISLRVEREDHEIDIRSFTLSPQTVSCEEETQLTAEIRNTGRRDESETFVRVTSPDLRFSYVSEELDLDVDDSARQTVVIPVPRATAPGTYRVTVETYYDTSIKSISEGILVRKAACGQDTPTTGTGSQDNNTNNDDDGDDSPVVVVTQPPAQPPASATNPPVQNTTQVTSTPNNQQSATQSFFESNGYMAALILGYMVVIGGGILVAIKLLRK